MPTEKELSSVFSDHYNSDKVSLQFICQIRLFSAVKAHILPQAVSHAFQDEGTIICMFSQAEDVWNRCVKLWSGSRASPAPISGRCVPILPYKIRAHYMTHTRLAAGTYYQQLPGTIFSAAQNHRLPKQGKPAKSGLRRVIGGAGSSRSGPVLKSYLVCN